MKRHIFTYTADELLPYIDWNYFLHAWGIDEKNSDTDEATRVKNDAIELLKEDSKNISIKALFALCDAHSEGEDIIIGKERLPLLRQQHCNSKKPNLCLSDFISPFNDNIGLFATSIAHAPEEKDGSDYYNNLLRQTTADRLVEAAALLTHLNVRTKPEIWGYAAGEKLSIEELLNERNAGIRPAVGYPSLPDQSIIFIIDRIINLKEIGIQLTENGAMHPHASICGLMISHPMAEYFAVGSITHEQLSDYAIRRKISTDKLSKFLSKNIK